MAKARTYELYLRMVPERLRVFSGAVERVTACRAEGWPCAVASSADRIKVEANLRKIGLPPESWEAVVTADLCVVVVEEMDALALEDSAAAAVAPAALAAGCPVIVLTGEDHTSRHQRAGLGIVGSYATGGPLGPAALAERVVRVARTWTR